MPIIYFDNFRGFEATFLSLKEINFFVGENSTGKTSILKLIGIVSSDEFWQFQQFGNKETSLGGFSEIITSKNRGFFEIGILGDETEDNRKIEAIKLKFIEQDNFPFLKEICLLNDYISIQITIDGNLLKYRYNLIDLNNTKELNREDIFKNWISNQGLNDKPFLRNQIEFNGIGIILFQLQTVISFQLKDNDRLKNIKLSIPSFLKNVAWIAPIRTEPQKTYDNYTSKFDSSGKHIPYALKKLFKDEDENLNQREDIKYILNRFGTDSGLYDKIDINVLGTAEDAPFEILLTLNERTQRITNVGYGVSQILPLIIEASIRNNNTWFAIQQPEIHLHPRAQAAFGEFVFKSNYCDNQRYIIETHSDYTIDRFRLRLNRAFNESSLFNTENIAQVVFFTKEQRGNKLETIEIQADGSYPNEQPAAFRDFFIQEQLELITI